MNRLSDVNFTAADQGQKKKTKPKTESTIEKGPSPDATPVRVSTRHIW